MHVGICFRGSRLLTNLTPCFFTLLVAQYDDPKDATLEAVMELLLELDQAEDVRPVLESKFGLKDALRDVVRSSNSNSWR